MGIIHHHKIVDKLKLMKETFGYIGWIKDWLDEAISKTGTREFVYCRE